VPNGGLVAIGLWFGEGDFLKTVNIIYRSADFTDADCNAANAAAVHRGNAGMKCLPANLVEPLHDRIVGSAMGGVKLTPPWMKNLRPRPAHRRSRLQDAGRKRRKIDAERISVAVEQPMTQPAELFALSGLTKFWNADWRLERAGFGGAGGGIGGIRGITHLEGDVLQRGLVTPFAVWSCAGRSNLAANRRSHYSRGGRNRVWELEVYAATK